MNWRRGLLRLWAVISVAWIGAAFIVADPIPKVRDPLAAYKDKFKLSEARAAGYTDDEIRAYLQIKGDAVNVDAIIDFGKIAILPPVLLFAIGCGGYWVRRGFTTVPSN